MNIQVRGDESSDSVEIVVQCNRNDREYQEILALLQTYGKKITGIKADGTHLVEIQKILYIESVDKKTFYYTRDDVFETSLRLFELEERLRDDDFFRAGKSLIINFRQLKSLKPDFGGRLQVTMSNGERLYVSRQYASEMKKKLEAVE